MGKLVAVFAASHAPGQVGFPELAPPEKKENVYRAWAELRKRFQEARPEVMVAVSNDHLQNFHRVQPPFCVGTSEWHLLPRPAYARMLGLEPRRFRGHPAFAESLLRVAAEQGKDLAFSEDLQFQDEFTVPKHFLDPEDEVPLVPILTNCLNRLQPPPRSFFELGRLIARTVACRPAGERVALIATGGLSHDPTGPNWCLVDEAFDRRFLDLLASGDAEGLFREYTLERIFEPGRGGTPEILNWFAALGAVGSGRRAKVLCYEAVPEWASGMGYVCWDL